MATIQGTGGSITLPTGFNAKLRNFSFDLNLQKADTTGFEDTGWMTEEITCQSLTGSASGTMEFDAASTTPVPATLMGATPTQSAARGSIVLTFATGCTWTFNGVVTQVTGDRDACDKSNITYNFSHQAGGVTQVWDETAPV